MRKYEDKEFIHILRHVATYHEIYKAVGIDRVSPEALKKTLIYDLNKPESTARAYIRALKGEDQGLFSYDAGRDVIFLNKESVYDFFLNANHLLCWSKFGFRNEYVKKMESGYKDLQNENYKMRMYINEHIKNS